jgi:TetR/AcrR family transcriptional regulator, fatty acid metabolism regulator protein
VAVTRSTESEDRAASARDRRRRQILEAAKEVFAERGYHSASINAIIKRAEIARGTFYLYFESKGKVFDSILDEAIEELRGRLTRIELGAGHPSPQQQLRGNLERIFDYVLGEPLLTQIFLSQGDSADSEVADRVADFWGQATSMVESSLRHGIGVGLVRECDTALVAAALLGAVRGLVGYLLATAEAPPLATIVDELMAFALSGVVEPIAWRSRE